MSEPTRRSTVAASPMTESRKGEGGGVCGQFQGVPPPTLKILFDALSAPVAVLGADGSLVHVNPVWEALAFEASSPLCTGRVGDSYLAACGAISPKICTGVGALLRGAQSVLLGGEGPIINAHLIKNDRGERRYRSVVTPAPRGCGWRVVVVLEPESSLPGELEPPTDSEKQLRLIFDNSPNCVAIKDHHGRYLMVNPATADLFKLPEEEIIGRTDRQIYQQLGLDPLQAETVMASDRQVIETGETQRSAEVRFELMGGSERWFSTTKTPVSSPEDPRCCLTIAVDVSGHHNTREALRNSELRLRTILDAQTSKVVHMDTEMRILWPNLAACKDAGVDRDTIIGKHCHEIWNARATTCTDCPVQAAIETGKPQMCQKRGQDGRTWRLIGSPVYDDAGRIVSAVEIAEDITERLSIEEQLRQAQKMESLGTLAGGIAHDFNNILSAILGYADLALAEAAGDTKLSDYLREIHDAGDRATDLVRQILTFSRRGTTELKPLMIDLIIKEALKLLRSTLPSTIDIVQRVSPGLDPILADPTQIHQIIMNLCTNASHAMTPAGGQLTVTLEQKELGADFFRRFVDAQPGSYLQLCVSDTGCGMTPEIMAAIFDPYFTTKDLGEGTGLGLAVVHGIVKEYGGDIRVRSKPDQGTTFELYFPTIRAASIRPQADKALHLPGGNEHILVVDDEPSILKVTEQLLRKLGYRVTTAPDGKPALALFSNDPNDFDLVITDITMPHLTGDRLAKAILELRPDTPVILCTGYSRLIDEAQAESIGIAALMIKPVGKTTLAVELRRLLDERPQGAQDGSTA